MERTLIRYLCKRPIRCIEPEHLRPAQDPSKSASESICRGIGRGADQDRGVRVVFENLVDSFDKRLCFA